jgi:cell division protein FtsA
MREVGNRYASMDIGSDSIKILIAEYTTKGLKIEHSLSTKSAGIVRGEIIDTNKCSKVIYDCIKKNKHKIRAITVNISSPLISSFDSEGTATISGKVDKNDIDSAIMNNSDYRILLENDKKIFEYPFGFSLDRDAKTRNPIKQKAKYLQVFYHLTSVDKQVIVDISNTIRKSGSIVEDNIISSIALQDFALTDEQKRSGVCLLDIGAQTCDIAIVKDNSIKYSATLDFGGDDIDDEISYHYDCENKEAKKIKELYGFAKNDSTKQEQFVGFMQFGTQKFLSNYELADVINQSLIKFFSKIKTIIKNQDIKVLGAGFVITGGVAKLDGFKILAREILKNKVNVFNIDNDFLKNNGIVPEKKLLKLDEYVLAFSLLSYVENLDYLQKSEEYNYASESLTGKLKRKVGIFSKTLEK